MEHPAELLVHSYLDEARQGLTTMSEENIQGIVKHVEQAVRKQFKTGESRKDFRLRASNIGKASCQLWFQKHKPEEAIPPPSHFLVRMMIGDITEAVFKGILKEAGAVFEEPEKVETEIAGEKIKGEYDLVLDNKVDDIKSTSPWSYKNKWIDGESIENSDPFGYVGQLTIYAKGKGVEAGGWWVVNHSSGEFKYIKYTSDPDVVIKKLEKTVEEVSNGKFVRCFSPVKETFHRKETGRHVLNTQCKFCNFRHACWGDRLTEQASTVSKAKNKPIVNYISM
tara:strand:- start:3594 stop:4436 length:843 start_codon:yes stop_codon:yes gene_type:complete